MTAVGPEVAGAPRPTANGSGGFRKALQSRDFRLLWGAQVASQLGDKFFAFSLLLSIYALTHLYLSDAALLLAYTIPAVFLSVPAGIFADRYDKRLLMLSTNLCRGVLVLGVPALEVTGIAQHQALPLFAITFVFAAVGQLFAPAEAASIPNLVGKEQLAAATSLFTVTIVLTIVVSVPLASLAQRVLGLEGPYYFGAGLFAVAAAANWMMRTRLSARAGAARPHLFRGTVGEVGEVLHLIRRSQVLPFAFGMLTLALAIVFTLFALSAGYMQHVLLRQPRDSYILLLPATFGMVVAGTVVSRRSSTVRAGRTVARGLILAGVAMLVLGVLPPVLSHFGLIPGLVPMAAVLAIVFGVGLGAVLIPCVVLIQLGTADATRGRIFGGAFLVINLAIALPLLVAGAAADVVGASAVLAFLGVCLMAVGALALARHWGRDPARPPAVTAR